MASELTIDLTERELEEAKEALIQLFEGLEEYAQAKTALVSVQKRMSQKYAEVNHLLKHIKPKAKEADDGKQEN